MSDTEDEAPDYLPHRVGRAAALQNSDIDDFVWLGEKGELDTAAVDAELFGPRAALREIALAIIDGCDLEGSRSREDRLSAAMQALAGVKANRGRKAVLSDEITLNIMAREFLRDFYGFSDGKRSSEQLYKSAIIPAALTFDL